MKRGYVLLFFIVGFILQSTMMLYINVLGITPNIILCLVVLFSFVFEGNQGIIYGIIFGLIQDICFSVLIGPAAISYFLVALLMIEIKRFLNRDSLLNVLLASLIATVIYYLINWGISTLFGGIYSFVYVARGTVILLVLNSIAMIIVYQLIGKRAIRYPQDRYYRGRSYY
ncbi:MAG: rod shape-determining protein MreD [Clostridiales bacterium]|nr:rod shape-determining protein MreD [Clostridiales bacterium]